MKSTASCKPAEVAIIRAEQLAREIEELLLVAARAESTTAQGCPYSIRMAQGLTRSLVDELAELRPTRRECLVDRDVLLHEGKSHVA